MKINIPTVFLFAGILSAFGENSNKKDIPRHERVWQEAKSKVFWQWRPNGWSLSINPSKRGYFGMADRAEMKISIWVREDQSPAEVASVFTHELAHAFDFIYLTPELRAKWLEKRGLPKNTPWFENRLKEGDRFCGAGDFAESVRWVMQDKIFKFDSKLGSPPNAEQSALIEHWLRALPETVR